jgi:hypothetical protein
LITQASFLREKNNSLHLKKTSGKRHPIEKWLAFGLPKKTFLFGAPKASVVNIWQRGPPSKTSMLKMAFWYSKNSRKNDTHSQDLLLAFRKKIDWILKKIAVSFVKTSQLTLYSVKIQYFSTSEVQDSRTPGLQNFRIQGSRNFEIQKSRNFEIQEFWTSEIQEFRRSW